MKILLTGSTGFIGTHLRKKLLEKHEVVALVRESTNIADLQKDGIKSIIFKDSLSELIQNLHTHQFDGVIHLASLYLKDHTESQIEDLINSNIKFPTLLLEACVQSNIKWFINTGTFWQHYNDEEYNPVNLYAATKQAFVDIAKYYQETSSIKIITLKLSDTFGPGDTRPKLFNLWNNTAMSGVILKMSGGEQIIDICYIDNITDAYAYLVQKLSQNLLSLKSEYALSCGEQMTLKELACVFEQETDKSLKIQWGAMPYRKREVMKPWTKGTSIPGWHPRITLREGIQKTFKENND